jgi:hypothetical protein
VSFSSLFSSKVENVSIWESLVEFMNLIKY